MLGLSAVGLLSTLQPPIPTFSTEFALDYTVSNLQYGFVAVGRCTAA